MQFIDTHCHLDMSSYSADFEQLMDRAQTAGLSHIITIGIDLESSKAAIALARRYKMVSATVGVHPHDIESLSDNVYSELCSLIENNRTHVVGYGEIGLDYFKNYSPHDKQRLHFQKQLQLAKKLELPVIIHDREAHDDILDILEKNGPFPAGGVMHCFSGNVAFAKKVLALGFHISIPGIVTFKNARDLHDVAKMVPLESLLLETDGPFLAPTPYRGKRNEPSYIPLIAEKIADLRNEDLLDIAQASTENAIKLFNLPVKNHDNFNKA